MTAKGSVEDLVKTLLRVAHTDLEKVRAIWTWICHHIGKQRTPPLNLDDMNIEDMNNAEPLFALLCGS